MVNYNKLQEMMKEKGLSQSFISEKIGMSRNYIKDCKRLNADIPEDRLEKIADLLGTTTDYLSDRSDDASQKQKKPAAISDELWERINKDPSALRFLERLYSMNEEQLSELDRFIAVLQEDNEVEK